MLTYWVLVTKDETGNITSLYSFDLKKELLDNIVEEQSVTDFRSYTKRRLTESLKNKNKIVFPKRFDQLEDKPIGSLQHWEPFKIKPNKKRPIFEKALPITGHIFNIFSILTNLFITFMTLKIAASRGDDDSTQSTILAISGAIFNSVINFVLYVVSDASNSLTETGYHLDNLCRKNDTPLLEVDILESPRKGICKFYSLSLTAGACILSNILIGAISQYQEQSLLIKRFLELYPTLSTDEQEQYFQLINYLVNISSIVAFGYTGVAFQGSFARKLVIHLIDKPAKSSQNADYPENARLISRLNSATDTLLLLESDVRTSEAGTRPASVLNVPQYVGFQNLQSYHPASQLEPPIPIRLKRKPSGDSSRVCPKCSTMY